MTTPSSSATIASPGFTSVPAQTIGTFTEPTVAFTVPFELIARLQTGNCISVRSLTSRQPGVDDEAADAVRAERRREQVAEHAVCVRAADGRHDDIAGMCELDRDVQHPVVAGMQQHGDARCRRCALPSRSGACRAAASPCGLAPRARSRRRARRARRRWPLSARSMFRTATFFTTSLPSAPRATAYTSAPIIRAQVGSARGRSRHRCTESKSST